MSRMNLVCLASSLLIGLAAPVGLAVAQDDDSVDCFFASNKSDPICQLPTSTAQSNKSAAITLEYSEPAAESVDCFYAENAAAPECSVPKSRTTVSHTHERVVHAGNNHGS